MIIFLDLRNHFFAFFRVKILKFFEDPGSGMETVRIRDPGWKKVGSGIRDKHPGSATLALTYSVPDPLAKILRFSLQSREHCIGVPKLNPTA